MSTNVAHSPFLRHDIVDRLLVQAKSEGDINKQIEMISAKIHLLVNSTSVGRTTTAKVPHEAPRPFITDDNLLKLELQSQSAELLFVRATGPSDDVKIDRRADIAEAEAVATGVLSDSTRMLNRAKKMESEASRLEARSKEKRQRQLDALREARIKALKVLIQVDEQAGKEGRVKRWKEQLEMSLGS